MAKVWRRPLSYFLSDFLVVSVCVYVCMKEVWLVVAVACHLWRNAWVMGEDF